jgi:hypothetical protein
MIVRCTNTPLDRKSKTGPAAGFLHSQEIRSFLTRLYDRSSM